MSARLLLLLLWLVPAGVAAEAYKARLEWAHTVPLRAVEAGIVQEVPVLVGQRVKRDEVLVRLDPRDFEIALDGARAELKGARAAADKAAIEQGWTEELYDRGLISENERRDAELKLTAAEAQAAVAQARVARAELDLERSVLRAPFDGVVTAVTAWPGMVVITRLQEEPLVEVADASRMVARARVVAARMDDFVPGQPARVRIEGAWRPARVYRLGVKSEDVIERGVTYALDVIFELTA
ncbi:MAG: efflux RND transporter periplasmic adaptor subunit, partial [Pseudomonadota bacterium]